MDDEELKRLRSLFANAEETPARSKVGAIVKKVTDRLARKPKDDDFKRFQPKGHKKAL